MLMQFRLRPAIFFPALTDDVSSAAKPLSSTEDDEHFLEDSVTADGMAALEELLDGDKHGAWIGEIKVVGITLDDNPFQHTPLAMDEAIANGFSKGFVGRGLVQTAITFKLKLDRNGMI